MKNPTSATRDVLVVDLDNTLIRTDILHEQVLQLLKTQPCLAFLIPFWLLRGVSHIKERLSAAAHIDPSRLPYRDHILGAINEARAAGKRVILASASHTRVVERVGQHLGVFDLVIGTEENLNLKGANKLQALRTHIHDAPFTYFGDSKADLPIWRQSAKAVAWNPSGKVERELKALGIPYEIKRDQPSTLRLLIKQMRVFQWVKNALLFVPVLAAHRFLDFNLWGRSAVAALAFSFMASAVYVMNDLLDLGSDRAHHTKRNRPFASGALPIFWGFILFPALLLGGLGLAVSLGYDVLGMVVAYFVLNMAYSWKLKEVLVIDTVILATFYTMRILTGSAATGIVTSTWLLAFSTFFFFGLAMVKRYTELLHSGDKKTIHGRGYVPGDQLPIFVIGVASSFLAILVLVLYLNSQDVLRLYSHPERLWPMTMVLLYWSARLWLLAHRDEVHDDPVIFSLKDRAGWAMMLVSAAILYWAM